MPQVQVKTFTRVKGKITGPRPPAVSMVMQIDLLPRGSGNRNFARRLGQAFKLHDLMGPHISRVVVGTSRVTVHFRPSFDAMEAVAEVKRRAREERSERDQLALAFG